MTKGKQNVFIGLTIVFTVTWFLAQLALISGAKASSPAEAKAASTQASVSLTYRTDVAGSPVIVIRGNAGALKAEDSADLELVQYKPRDGRDLLVYQVIVP